MKRALRFWFVSIFVPLFSMAQNADTTGMAKVLSKGKSEANQTLTFDALQKSFHLSQDAVALLQANTNVYVNNYGLSNLSTMSIRGSSVAQTAVLWNGLPIQNTMLGLADLSTIPNFFFDEMSIQTAGYLEKGIFQSMAGSLNLKSTNQFTNQVGGLMQSIAGYESFGNMVLGAKAKLTNRQWNADVKYFNRQGGNAYRFYNFYHDAFDTLRDAFGVQEQFMVDLAYRPNLRHTFQLHYWHLANRRKIAPLAFETNNTRSETNKIDRLGLSHEFMKNKLRWDSKIGLTIDSFGYQDASIGLQSQARVFNVPVISNISYYIHDNWDVGLTYSSQWSFYKQQQLNKEIFQSAVQFHIHRKALFWGLSFQGYMQKIMASIGQNPFVYGGRLGKELGKCYEFFIAYNTNYRLPTLNELYNFPGGNEQLAPELAKNASLGCDVTYDWKNWSLMNRSAIYSRWVQDWILWSGSAIFFPDNIAEVWSRGIENDISVRYTKNHWDIRNDFFLSLSKATSQRAYYSNDQSIHKQIPYVPQTSWRNNFFISYKHTTLQCSYSYTGYRFFTRDESQWVDPNQLLNCYISQKILFRNQQLELQFKVNNLLNERYESLRGRIMPLRNYAINLLYTRQH